MKNKFKFKTTSEYHKELECSMQRARELSLKSFQHVQIEQAKTIEDLKCVLHQLVDYEKIP